MNQNTQIKYKELKAKILELQHPKQLQLSGAEFISDTQKFLNTHFKVIESNPKRRVVIPYYNRLLKFYILVKKQ